MSNTLEIARFVVKPENTEGMLAARGPMIDHLASTYPSFVRSWMARIDERVWVDYAEWSDREEAERAAREVLESPTCNVYFGFIEEVLSMEHGELVVAVGADG